MSNQTSTAGPTRTDQLAAEYQPMGAVGQDQPRTADQSMVVFLGQNGCGKSHLMQSHPGLAIANFQQTPTTNANPVAEMWPRDSGEPIAWPDFVEFVTHVVDANLRGLKNAPTGIGIDSYVDMLECAYKYSALLLYNRRNKTEKKTLAEITPWDTVNEDGQAVWGLAYSWIKDVIRACKSAYVGLVFAVPVAHLFVEYRKERETIKEERLEPMLSKSGQQFRILQDSADALLFVTKEKQTRTVQQDREVTVRGKTFTKKENVSVVGVRQVVLSDYEKMERYLKIRSAKMRLPEVIEISDTGWAGFAEPWNKCAGVPAGSTSK